MIDKIATSIAHALLGIRDGATVLVGGFSTAGNPDELIEGLIEHGARDLTVVRQRGQRRHRTGSVAQGGPRAQDHLQLSRQADTHVFDGLYRAGRIELEHEFPAGHAELEGLVGMPLAGGAS